MKIKVIFFSKPALATIPIDFFRTLIIEHVFTKKTLMELPYFIEISLVFQYFPDSPYVNRFLFCNFMQKLMNNTFVKQFFFIFGKITICNINYQENLICTAGFNIFWIISSKSMCFNPFRNIGFLCISEEKT